MLRTLKYLPRVLKDILFRNIYKFTGKSNFPKSIIPNSKYVSVIDLQALLKNTPVFIIRRSDKTPTETFNEIGILRSDAITPKSVPLLSLNLLGAEFKPEHSAFRIIQNGAKKWKAKEPIFLTEHLNDFEILNNYCIVYLDANGLNGQDVPYSQTKTKELSREIEKFFFHIQKPIIEDGEYMLKGQTKLIHDPIKLNYWHLELNLYNYSNKVIKYRDSKYIEDFCKKVVTDIICVNSYKELSEIPIIPKEYYMESACA